MVHHCAEIGGTVWSMEIRHTMHHGPLLALRSAECSGLICGRLALIGKETRQEFLDLKSASIRWVD